MSRGSLSAKERVKRRPECSMKGEVFRGRSEDSQSWGRTSIRSMLLKGCQERYLESQRRVKSGQVRDEERDVVFIIYGLVDCSRILTILSEIWIIKGTLANKRA